MMMRGLQVVSFSGEPPRPDKRFCAARATFFPRELFFWDSCGAMWTKMNLPGTIGSLARISARHKLLPIFEIQAWRTASSSSLEIQA